MRSRHGKCHLLNSEATVSGNHLATNISFHLELFDKLCGACVESAIYSLLWNNAVVTNFPTSGFAEWELWKQMQRLHAMRYILNSVKQHGRHTISQLTSRFTQLEILKIYAGNDGDSDIYSTLWEITVGKPSFKQHHVFTVRRVWKPMPNLCGKFHILKYVEEHCVEIIF